MELFAVFSFIPVLIIILLVFIMSSMYRVVPVNSVDVVVSRTRTRVYSGDPNYSQKGRAYRRRFVEIC